MSREGGLARRDGTIQAPNSIGSGGGSRSTTDEQFVEMEPWAAWELMPDEVFLALELEGFDLSRPFVSGSNPPKIRRRGSRYLARTTAWQVHRNSLTLVFARRDLEKTGRSTFKPCSPWVLDIRSQPMTGRVRERSGTVPSDVDVESDGNSNHDDGGTSPDLTEFVPGPVRRQVLSAVPNPEFQDDYLFEGYDKGLPCEHEAGLLRTTSEKLVAMSATRSVQVESSMSERQANEALSRSPWSVTVVTANLGREEITEIVAEVDGPRSIDRDGRDQIEGSEVRKLPE